MHRANSKVAMALDDVEGSVHVNYLVSSVLTGG